MSRHIVAAAVAASLSIFASAAADAEDYSRLARAAGLSDLDARELSLDAIAAAKFRRDTPDDQQGYVARLSAADGARGAAVRSSRTAELDALHLQRINSGVSGNERQAVITRGGVSPNLQARLRLAATAGISAADAERMSLSEVAMHKFYRDTDSE